jgi:hypothetical protein
LVDLIKITPERIETRNTSNQVTFSTDINYLRTDPAGDFRVGGINRAPCISGADSSEPYTFLDQVGNQGYFGLISRSSDMLNIGSAWEAHFYVPEDPTAVMGLLTATAGAPQLGGGMMGAFYSPSSHNVFLHRRPNTGADWVFVASGPVVWLSWALFAQPNSPPLTQGQNNLINGQYGSFDPSPFFLAHRGNYFRITVPSNWASFGYPQNSPESAIMTYNIPTFSIPQQTLALSVTP